MPEKLSCKNCGRTDCRAQSLSIKEVRLMLECDGLREALKEFRTKVTEGWIPEGKVL